MVRHYKRRTLGNFSEDAMKEAVKLVLEGYPLRKAATAKNVKFQTLARYVKKQKDNPNTKIHMCPRYNCRLVFNKNQEKTLVNYLIKCSKMCYGLNTTECKKFAFELAKKNDLVIPKTWETNQSAGPDWLSSFLKRNKELSLRSPEACSLSRATSFNRHNVMLFFEKLSNIMQRNPKFSDGSRIYNLDETGVTTVQTPKKVLAEKGTKRLNKVTSAERGVLVTVCCIINAYGSSLPPVFIFPRVNFKQHMLIGAPRGAIGLATPSGWMNSLLFIEVLDHFIKYTNCSIDNPALLIMDNHESHVSIECIEKAKSNGITILTLPPHCSNRMQPLDVSVYGPFKTFYNNAVDSWLQMHPGKILSIYEVADCVRIAFERSMTPSNIISGFRATGIFPYDKDVFNENDYLVSAVTDRKETQLEATNSNNTIFNLDNSNPINIFTEKTFVSPEELRGYPKAEARKIKKNNRRKGKSTILTDTPEKDLIEEKKSNNTNVKQCNKINKNLFSTELKKESINTNNFKKTKNKQISNTMTPDVYFPSSDEEDICGKITPLVVTSEDEIDDNDLTKYEELAKEPKEGDYVLVKFKTSKLAVIYFVGKIIKEKDEESDIEVSYLRRYKKSNYKFCMPDIPDLASVSINDIQRILPSPKVMGFTKRQQSYLSFEVDLSNFNLG